MIFHTIISVLLAGGLATNEPIFEVQRLEASEVAGRLVEFSTERLVLDTTEGKRTLPLVDLLSLRPKDSSASLVPAPAPSVWVELSDGSTLAVSHFLTEGKRAKIVLADGVSLDLPLQAVGHVRFQSDSTPNASEWNRLLKKSFDGDLLVVKNGDSLDYHQGLLRDISEDAVQFELDGEVLSIKRKKVFGFVYRHPTGTDLPKTQGIVTDRSGSRWNVAQFTFNEKLAWTTPSGIKVERSLPEVVHIDLSRGKLLYLSDLVPESSVWTPYFGQASASSVLEQFYMPRKDRNFDSKSLKLGKEIFAKGLAIHSRTEMVYRLPDAFRRLKAVAGIDELAAPQGRVRLIVRGDEKVLFDAVLSAGQTPQSIDVNLTGVRRLTILVDFPDQLGVGNSLILGNARISK